MFLGGGQFPVGSSCGLMNPSLFESKNLTYCRRFAGPSRVGLLIVWGRSDDILSERLLVQNETPPGPPAVFNYMLLNTT
jgi:hypothetical protein